MIRSRQLDGIRGAACLLVLISHLGHSGIAGIDGLAGIGKYGVWIFFVLSGFLMAKIAEPGCKKDRYWFVYIVRRFLRIYPLYMVTVILFLIVSYTVGGIKFSFLDAIRHLLLENGYRHLWAIPVEFKFYLIFPLIFLMVSSFNIQKKILVLILMVIFFSVFRHFSGSNSIALIEYLDIFLIGMLVYYLSEYELAVRFLERNYVPLILGFMIFSVFTVPGVYSYFFYTVEFNYFHGVGEIFGIAYGVLILLSLNAGRYVNKIFSNVVITYIGDRSYSYYLLHPFILFACKNYIDGVLSVFVFFSSVIIVGSLSYRFIEKPFINYGRKI